MYLNPCVKDPAPTKKNRARTKKTFDKAIFLIKAIVITVTKAQCLSRYSFKTG